MKALEAAAWLVLIAIVGAVVGLGYLVYRLVENTLSTIDRTWGAGFYLVGGGAMLLAFVLVIVGGAIVFVQWMARRARYIHARDGMFPVQERRGGAFANPNEAGAQSLAVMAAAGKRPTAALAGRVIDAQYAARDYTPPAIEAATGQAAAPALPVTARDVVASVNLRTSPHWLLIGATGSGKTSASYSILDEMRSAAPCEFRITEPGGVNWGGQAAATRSNDIAEVIIETQRDMERRQDLLVAEDVDHIEDLDDPPPYIVLVAEEMDAVLDNLKLTNLERRKQVLIALRDLARMGRKPGICLFAVSQSGTTDVFDSHVRKNMKNVLLFQSEHTVNEMWRVDVRLAELPIGAAYSVRHASVVQFPQARRPQLALPQPLQPAQLIDGIPASNWPTTELVAPVAPVVQRLERGREPDSQLAAQLRKLYAAGHSKTRLCLEVWGYKDGPTWAILERTLNGEL